MRQLSKTVRGIQRSPIRTMKDAAAAYPDSIHLELGQPDFPTPPHVIEAACQAAQHEYTGYTANAGMLALRQAVVTKLERENGYTAPVDGIVVTVGAMEAVFASMAVLLDPDDEVLVPNPGYGNFCMAAHVLNAKPIHYPTIPDRGFVPDIDLLEKLITDRTRVLLVSSPSNPTGAVYDERTLRDLYEFCVRHDLYMISDETYDQLVFEGEHISPARWDRDGRVISIYTTSKTYAMTGWRVGFVVASPEVAAAIIKVQEPIVSCVNTVAQHAAIGALLGPQDCVDAMRNEYRQRRDLAVALADELGLEVSYPHGAFYLLANISASGQDSIPFCQGLLEAEHLAVAPGSSFGSVLDSYVRISLCAGPAELKEGLTRLARYLRRQAKELAAKGTSETIRVTA
ncbi:MAG: pyridoxal phosphate-dependent aminotransferase [Anaerolineae bacterium]